MRSVRCPFCAKDVELAEAAAGDTTPCPECGRPVSSKTSNYDTLRHDASPLLAPALNPGEIGRLARFRILEVFGQGGMGIVYRAEDPTLNRQVAIKVILPKFAADPKAANRFKREMLAAAALQHDHIASVFEIGEDRGILYMTMPLLKGESLQTFLRGKKSPMPVAESIRIAREIAEGLAAAHAIGIVHRDIKPGNVWLDGPKRSVKILDFGLSRSVGPEADPLTRPGEILGTPAFMAPEQARGKAVDERADLFSLGCVLYQMLTARLPFSGNDTMAILTSIAVDTPPPPRTRNADVSPELSELTMRLLAKSPEDRPRSAADVVAELTNCEAAPIPRNQSTASFGSPRRVPGRTRWIAAACVLLIALAVVGTAVALLFVSRTPIDPPRQGGDVGAIAADRRAAEYGLSINATVRIDDNDRDLDPPGKLPAGPFRLTQVHFPNIRTLDLDRLVLFEPCRRLRYVNLSVTNADDRALAHFAGCTELVFLAVAKTDVTDRGIEPFERSPKLLELYVQGSKITPAKVESLIRSLPQCRITHDGGVSEPVSGPNRK